MQQSNNGQQIANVKAVSCRVKSTVYCLWLRQVVGQLHRAVRKQKQENMLLLTEIPETVKIAIINHLQLYYNFLQVYYSSLKK
jgi:hypothetical protein